MANKKESKTRSEQLPQEAPVEQAPQAAPVEQAPQAAPVQQAPQPAPAQQAPQPAPVPRQVAPSPSAGGFSLRGRVIDECNAGIERVCVLVLYRRQVVAQTESRERGVYEVTLNIPQFDWCKIEVVFCKHFFDVESNCRLELMTPPIVELDFGGRSVASFDAPVTIYCGCTAGAIRSSVDVVKQRITQYKTCFVKMEQQLVQVRTVFEQKRFRAVFEINSLIALTQAEQRWLAFEERCLSSQRVRTVETVLSTRTQRQVLFVERRLLRLLLFANVLLKPRSDEIVEEAKIIRNTIEKALQQFRQTVECGWIADPCGKGPSPAVN